MACCSEHHKKLDANGVGKCSVPAWIDGCPAGFCDKPAYGEPIVPWGIWSDHEKRVRRTDGVYEGYVPYLACPGHGGPKEPYFDVVFDGPPSHESGRFVEVENAQGHGMKMGEWIQRPDGFWVLRLPLPPVKQPQEV